MSQTDDARTTCRSNTALCVASPFARKLTPLSSLASSRGVLRGPLRLRLLQPTLILMMVFLAVLLFFFQNVKI